MAGYYLGNVGSPWKLDDNHVPQHGVHIKILNSAVVHIDDCFMSRSS